MPKDIHGLLEGYKKFRRKYFDGNNPLFEELVKQGQRPKALIIACSDSRVDPGILLDCSPGDLFVIRNVANLVPSCDGDDASYHGTSAALEFAVCELNIKHIVILGHSQCGGIYALMDHIDLLEKKKFIGKWVQLAKAARTQVFSEHPKASTEEQAILCGQYAIRHSINNLSTFPWVAEKMREGNLYVHGWYFDLQTGKLLTLNPDNDHFEEWNTASVD